MCKDETMMKISSIEEQLLSMLEIESMKGLENVDAEEMGKVVDMVKDLGEAKYYCSIVLAMEEEQGEAMGYNNRRYASGRFAPKGRGGMGYEPMHEPMEMYGMGYSGGGSQGGAGYSQGGQGMGYGSAYSRYQQARMGYTQTRDKTAKKGMDDAANEHMREVTDSMRDIWQEADQPQRVQLKNSLMRLMNELN